MTDALATARTEIAEACRDLARRGLVIGSAGNVSVRIKDRIALTASGARFESMTPEQVTIVTLDGVVTDGDFAPTSELNLHLGIYLNVGSTAVVHTHAPEAISVGLVVDELPCVHYQMLLLGGAVPVAAYQRFGSVELAATVVSALKGKAAALMANHGAVTHGSSLAEAVEQSLLLEWACGIYLRAAAAGVPRAISAADQEAVINHAVSTGYGVTHPSDSGATP